MSVIGTLAADWTPSASCASQTGLYQLETVIGNEIYDYKVRGPTDTAACMPPSYTAATASAATNYYYPASVCPSGYTTGCNPTATNSIVDNSVVPLIAYTCCPTGAIAFSCFSGEAGYPWMSTLGCSTSMAATMTTTVTGVDTNGSTTVFETIATPGYYAGWGAYAVVMLAPEASATSSSSSSSSSAASAGTSNSAATATATSVSDSSGASTTSNKSISAGAWAGIGIGLGVAVAALGFFIFLACQRKRRRGRNPPGLDDKSADEGAETPSTTNHANSATTELGGGDPRYKAEELSAHQTAHPHGAMAEMGGHQYPNPTYAAEVLGDESAARHEADCPPAVFELPEAGR